MSDARAVLDADSFSEFRKQIDKTLGVLERAYGKGSSSAFSGSSPDEVREAIFSRSSFPEEGIGFSRTLADFGKRLLPHMVKPSLSGYMAHLHSPVLVESLSAELLISAFNQSMDSWDQSPAATELEMAVLNELCGIYGYGAAADGTFTSGGTQSNFQAVLVARDLALARLGQDVRMHGLDGGAKLTVYVSELAHFSFAKAAQILGMGSDCVRLIPADSRMKMDVGALRDRIAEDVGKGFVPALAVSTIGTTDYGSVDDTAAMRKVCDEFGVRLHCDAAYGSAVRFSRKNSARIGAVELSDSITVDFHKMFLLPISCSCVLFRNGGDLDRLKFHADYLNREEDEEDGYDNLVSKSLQTTRRFDALKVYFSFMCRGKSGIGRMVDGLLENAAYFYGRLSADGRVEVLNEPELSSVVFRLLPPEGCGQTADEFNVSVRRRLMHEFGMIVGQTVARGRVYLKFTLLNPSLGRDDFDAVMLLLDGLLTII